jgi:hypothetical protein
MGYCQMREMPVTVTNPHEHPNLDSDSINMQRTFIDSSRTNL